MGKRKVRLPLSRSLLGMPDAPCNLCGSAERLLDVPMDGKRRVGLCSTCLCERTLGGRALPRGRDGDLVRLVVAVRYYARREEVEPLLGCSRAAFLASAKREVERIIDEQETGSIVCRLALAAVLDGERLTKENERCVDVTAVLARGPVRTLLAPAGSWFAT